MRAIILIAFLSLCSADVQSEADMIAKVKAAICSGQSSWVAFAKQHFECERKVSTELENKNRQECYKKVLSRDVTKSFDEELKLLCSLSDAKKWDELDTCIKQPTQPGLNVTDFTLRVDVTTLCNANQSNN